MARENVRHKKRGILRYSISDGPLVFVPLQGGGVRQQKVKEKFRLQHGVGTERLIQRGIMKELERHYHR